MSNREVQPHPSRSYMSGQSTDLNQSAWMGHWLRTKQKKPRDGSLSLQEEDGGEMKQHSSTFNQVSDPFGHESLNAVKEVARDGSVEATNWHLYDGSNLKNERTNLLSFPIFNIPQKGGASGTQVRGTQIGQCSKFSDAGFAMDGCKFQETDMVSTSRKFLRTETTPNLELELRARDSGEGSCVPAVRLAQDKLTGMPGGYPHGIVYRTEKVIPFTTMPREHLSHCSSYNCFNVETMRISSVVDVSHDISLGLPMNAETTRHFHITEQTAIDISGEGKIFRESFLSTKFTGDLGELLTLSPASGKLRPGLKLRLLDGSTDSELNDRSIEGNQKDESNKSIGKLHTVAGLTIETSAETLTMDVDASSENNHINDLAVSMSNKDVLTGQITASSQGNVVITGLPDMNVEALAPEGSTDDGDHSTSRTESLDVECILSKGDYPSSSKSNPHHLIDPGLEVGNRWVKRLKLSGSKFLALGSKSSTIEEASSCTKLPKLSSTLWNSSSGLAGSEPAMDSLLRQTSDSKKMAAGISKLSNGGKSPSTYSSREDSDTLLSHSWIRRWRHFKKTSPKNQAAPTEPSEPDSPKTNFEHVPKKTFPSIAAMALMGKAMNGFQPCEFTKKGSFIVWKTKNFPND